MNPNEILEQAMSKIDETASNLNPILFSAGTKNLDETKALLSSLRPFLEDIDTKDQQILGMHVSLAEKDKQIVGLKEKLNYLETLTIDCHNHCSYMDEKNQQISDLTAKLDASQELVKELVLIAKHDRAATVELRNMSSGGTYKNFTETIERIDTTLAAAEGQKEKKK
jgi:hypothetical protein